MGGVGWRTDASKVEPAYRRRTAPVSANRQIVAASDRGTQPGRTGASLPVAARQRAFAANVSQALSSPDSIPRRSQYTRWSLVPCVKLSGTT